MTQATLESPKPRQTTTQAVRKPTRSGARRAAVPVEAADTALRDACATLAHAAANAGDLAPRLFRRVLQMVVESADPRREACAADELLAEMSRGDLQTGRPILCPDGVSPD